MKSRNSILVIMIILMIFTFAGCKNKNTSSVRLNSPDKINMYADGKQKQISKSGDGYEQTLFERIKSLIDIRIPSELSVAQSVYTENDIKDIKAYSVEFVYDKPQTVTIDNGNKAQVKFTNIYFPLGGKWQNTAFIMIKDNQYTIVGLKENLDYLVKASVK